MDIHEHLNNGVLDVELRLPGSEPAWTRFDLSCMISQVTLHGKHQFCQPEQTEKHPNRITCYGFGISSEFCMNELPTALPEGAQFPKPGVGILTQKKGGGAYDIFNLYEVRRFTKTWHIEKEAAVFHEIDTPCLGIAMEIDRSVKLDGNRITITTEIRNTGSKTIDMTQYDHNFFAIDDIPIGKGYRLEIPFDGELERLSGQFTTLEPEKVPIPAPVSIEDGVVTWTDTMENRTFHKVTGKSGIPELPNYSWRISCAQSSASVREICGFAPETVVMWGIEHCICPEIHKRITIEPSGSESFSRTWVFDDEDTCN